MRGKTRNLRSSSGFPPSSGKRAPKNFFASYADRLERHDVALLRKSQVAGLSAPGFPAFLRASGRDRARKWDGDLVERHM